VIWDFAGQPIPSELLDDLRAFGEQSTDSSKVPPVLERLLSRREVKMLRRRRDRLLKSGCFPQPGPGRNVPWPLV
jgi:hypothetical protein